MKFERWERSHTLRGGSSSGQVVGHWPMWDSDNSFLEIREHPGGAAGSCELFGGGSRLTPILPNLLKASRRPALSSPSPSGGYETPCFLVKPSFLTRRLQHDSPTSGFSPYFHIQIPKSFLDATTWMTC